jgi:hypothetical protein
MEIGLGKGTASSRSRNSAGRIVARDEATHDGECLQEPRFVALGAGWAAPILDKGFIHVIEPVFKGSAQPKVVILSGGQLGVKKADGVKYFSSNQGGGVAHRVIGK